MRFFVPFDARTPNTRLAPVLDEGERFAFARAMCLDVLAALADAGHDAVVLSTAKFECDAPVRVDSRSLSVAVNAALEETTVPVGVVMADLPLVTAAVFEKLTAPDADVVIAPGLGGGTNAFVTRHSDFQVDYHDGSYQKHRQIVNDCDLALATVDSFRLAVDIDDPTDIAETLIHSDETAAAWLRSVGFELDTQNGRTVAVRS